MYYHAAAPRGSITVDPGSFGILATMTHGIRVLAASDGEVIGEASPVVTVTREGVKPVGNDPINESGFAVGSRSDVGLVATRAFDRRFDLDSTVQSFDTASKGIGSTLAQIDGGQTSYRMVGNAMFGDVGLFGEFDPFSPDDAVGYTAVVDGDSVAWTPPDPGALSVRGGGSDPDNPVGAFLAFDTSDGSPTAYRAFTSDVGADTFGPVFDVSGGLAGANVARLNQVVYDAGNGLGMAGFASNDLCPAPLLEEFDTSAQTAISVAGVGFGDPFSMAIDRTHGVVAVANSCSPDLGLYDLASGQASLVDLGQPGYYVAGDGDHDLILVAKAVPPDFLRNHVAQSSIAVYDSEGSYQKEITGVYLWDTPLVPGLDGLQVDPASRTAWIFGPFGRQLEPIDY
jgi:hypothetical protein